MNIRRCLPVAGYDYEIAKAGDRPRHILEEIIWHKEREVAQRQREVPLAALLEKTAIAQTTHPPRDFLGALHQSAARPALIAEVKKASPSRGLLRAEFDPAAIAIAYARGGAACLSVLTDERYFQGGFEYLQRVRQAVDLPLLCKEFVIDPYQVYLARLYGADAILLIAAVLEDSNLQALHDLARSLGLAVLVEVHTRAERDRVLALSGIQLMGINNRNLETFAVDLATTQELLMGIDTQAGDRLWVSESGLYGRADLDRVAACGAGAVLVGESLVKQPDIAAATTRLLLG